MRKWVVSPDSILLDFVSGEKGKEKGKKKPHKEIVIVWTAYSAQVIKHIPALLDKNTGMDWTDQERRDQMFLCME